MSVRTRVGRWAGALAILLAVLVALTWLEQHAKVDRAPLQQMLRDVAADVQRHYYDAKLNGLDWDVAVRQTRDKIDIANSQDAAVSEIAALLDSLNDSHTFLVPPPRTHVYDYRFAIEMIGDRCYVIRVRPRSDAEKKGLKAGDQILTINQHPVSRKTLWRILYIYKALRPQPGLQLVVEDDAGHSRQVDVMAEVRVSPVLKYFLHDAANHRVRDRINYYHLERPRYFEKGNSLLVVKIPEFAMSAYEVDSVIGKMRAHKGVVLDLRGIPGGFEDTLQRLLGGVFESDVKIGDRVGRKSTRPLVANGRHHDAYTGGFAVLVDHGSASASELFARVVQLEKRGFVVGDRSAGAVMVAEDYGHELGVDSDLSYGTSVSVENLIMSDGKSLEHVGVEPDIQILPTGQDLRSKRDPVLSKAATLVGGQLTPEEAGALFPYEELGEK